MGSSCSRSKVAYRASCVAATARWTVDDSGRLLMSRELVLDGVSGDIQIQIASDLHLEFFDNPRDPVQAAELSALVVPHAPVLALLGDIGDPTSDVYRDFLVKQAGQFQAVLVLTGNHEYYSPEGKVCSVDELESVIERICAESPGLHFVDNTCVRFGTGPMAPALLCTPLWSEIPDSALEEVGSSMNDYHLSFVRSAKNAVQRLTPQVTRAWHRAAVAWLQVEMQRLKDAGCERIGVLSHHTPLLKGTSKPKYEAADNLLQHAFSSNLSALISAEPALKLWAYGHTHYNNDRIVAGSRLVSNQRGYRGSEESANSGYRADFVTSF